MYVEKGTLVFDGVAISDTEAVRDLRTPHARRPSAGAASADQWRVQLYGGALYLDDGSVAFRGSSTITRSRAVRLPGTCMPMHTCAHACASTRMHTVTRSGTQSHAQAHTRTRVHMLT